ncbi:MAG: ATP-binding cassette domain-containing protein [Maribacter sp.]|uniref:ATP-binding cassette domain-containing protein n=1 Tax=Maribacter sp. TaxID=1897614 RepID=UPI003299BDF2
MSIQHWAIKITNDANKSKLVRKLLGGTVDEFSFLNGLQGMLFSPLALERFIDEEDRHDNKIITQETSQSLRTMSSGEQKKALLNYLFDQHTDFIILDNPFDNLDVESQEQLVNTLADRSHQTTFIQIISRKEDLLPFISNFASLNADRLCIHDAQNNLFETKENSSFTRPIPDALQPIEFKHERLIELRDVTVSFENRTILRNINWTIKKGEFWELSGKNGSGKTTILSMLTGENPKGYGQDLFLFGKKKGSGESIWDIKKKIGYFTPAMTMKFTGYHTVENMLISGLNDSIGLYIRPTESQLRLAKEWLKLIHLWDKKDRLFHELSMGEKRLIMTTRAMIKHPLLLILDEPTAGLDDTSARLLVELVNKIAHESDTTTIFVSHRKEPGLKADFIYQLQMNENGSTGHVISRS